MWRSLGQSYNVLDNVVLTTKKIFKSLASVFFAFYFFFFGFSMFWISIFCVSIVALLSERRSVHWRAPA